MAENKEVRPHATDEILKKSATGFGKLVSQSQNQQGSQGGQQQSSGQQSNNQADKK